VAKYHIAQVNIGRARAPLDDARMAAFMSRLDEINALADRSPGFVWRLQTDEGNATYFRPYADDDHVLLNVSVWETIEALKHYMYRTAHADLLRHRHEWFENFAGAYMALWWVPVGHRPGIDEAHRALERARSDAVRLHVQENIFAGRGISEGNRLVVVRAVPGNLRTEMEIGRSKMAQRRTFSGR
jgi:Domain of unknown function (DUF3291)